MARAAGIFRWQGNGAGTKTAFDDGRNWVNESGTPYDQAQYPSYDGALSANVDGDSIWFDTAITNSPAGIDISAKGDIGSLIVGPAFNGTIGSSGTPLVIDTQTAIMAQITGTGAGNIFLKGAGTNGIRTMIVNDMKSASTLTLDGDIDNLRLMKGTVAFAATMTISTSLYISYTNNKTGDVSLTIPAGVTPPSTVYVSGGTITCSVGITTLIQSGGIWTHNLGTVGNLVISDGKFIWNAGTITASNMFGGVLDGTQSITTRTCTTLNYYKGKMNFNTETDAITVTNLYCLNTTPDLTVNSGQKLTI